MGSFIIRFVDIVFSVSVLVILTPLWLIVVPLLRVTGEGDVFYRQERVGRGAKSFYLLKFATMKRNSSSFGSGEVTLRNDPRVLPVGRFLRKTKINELPQLINILNGDMSLVGWRPQTPKYFRAFSIEIQTVLSMSRPGLSGIGSIIFRDEEEILSRAESPVRFDLDFVVPYKGELEKWFAERVSVATYFLIIGLTAWVVIFPRSRLIWRVFPDLPRPPGELAEGLGF